MGSADIYRQLARGLHLRLSVNRRAASDPEHFWFLKPLYPFVHEPEHLSVDVAHATERYPWGGTLTAQTRVFAVSHYLRMQVNRIMNERFIKPLPGAVLFRAEFQFRDTLNQPQPMWLVPGMVLQGCCPSCDSDIVNGVLYEILSARSEAGIPWVWVRMLERYRQPGEPREAVGLCETEASRRLRLTHCVTYRAAQGCTIGDDTPVLLLDTSHKYLDHKMFIVGLSRVASGKQLRVATRAQQQEVFGWAGQAREDPQRTGISDMMSALPVHPERPQGRHDSDAESDATESESESEPQERDRRSDSESEDE